MIAIIAVCAVLLQNPTAVESTTSGTHDKQMTSQPPENVAMDGDEMDRLIWYLYYGEWLSGGGVEEPSTSKPDATTGNEAVRKTSAK